MDLVRGIAACVISDALVPQTFRMGRMAWTDDPHPLRICVIHKTPIAYAFGTRTPLAPSSPRRSSHARSAREISLVDPARARRAMSYVSYARTHRIGHVPRRSRARRSRRSKNRPRSPARARPAPAQCTTCTEDNPYIATSRRLTSDFVALPSVGLFHKALLAKCSVLSLII